MGWDISYHPLGEDEISAIYFAGIANPELAKTFAERFNVPEFHRENLAKAFAYNGVTVDSVDGTESMNGSFSKGHGMNLAVVAGHLRKYWYVRGSAMSFLADDPDFSGYFSDFRELVPETYRHLRFDNKLTENYCCGVYMNNAALRRLAEAMESRPPIREKMANLFSDGRLDVFMAATRYALDENLGLLEAAEIIEPNPFNLNSSKSYTNLHNCDPAGAILFREAAMEQIAAIEREDAASQEKKEAPPAKQSFFSKLFGKK
ncbi:MAG: hypothetical protein LBU76_11175 [Azoarcus sp.]|jgi:hypothetical protein|nr:hypothetical protein [Azoarcus sp.]